MNNHRIICEFTSPKVRSFIPFISIRLLTFTLALTIAHTAMSQESEAPLNFPCPLDAQECPIASHKIFDCEECPPNLIGIEVEPSLAFGFHGSIYPVNFQGKSYVMKTVNTLAPSMNDELRRCVADVFNNEVAIFENIPYHRHVVTPKIAYFTSDGDVAGLVLEKLEMNIRERLEPKNLTIDQSKHYIKSLISGIEHLHRHLICQNDLGLQNIMIDSHDDLKIIDFSRGIRVGNISELREGSYLDRLRLTHAITSILSATKNKEEGQTLLSKLQRFNSLLLLFEDHDGWFTDYLEVLHEMTVLVEQ